MSQRKSLEKRHKNLHCVALIKQQTAKCHQMLQVQRHATQRKRVKQISINWSLKAKVKR